MPVIELQSLSKWYGEVIGLNNVTTSIGPGLTGLVGPNGAGKSTLMGLAMGQLRPSKGTLRVLGSDPGIARLSSRRSVTARRATRFGRT